MATRWRKILGRDAYRDMQKVYPDIDGMDIVAHPVLKKAEHTVHQDKYFTEWARHREMVR